MVYLLIILLMIVLFRRRGPRDNIPVEDWKMETKVEELEVRIKVLEESFLVKESELAKIRSMLDVRSDSGRL